MRVGGVSSALRHKSRTSHLSYKVCIHTYMEIMHEELFFVTVHCLMGFEVQEGGAGVEGSLKSEVLPVASIEIMKALKC